MPLQTLHALARGLFQKRWLPLILTFALYLIAGKLGQFVFIEFHTSPALIWLPPAIALVAVYLYGNAMLLPVAVGQLILSMTGPLGPPLWLAATITTAYTFQAWFGAALLKRFNFHRSLARIHDAIVLLAVGAVIVAIGPAISALVTSVVQLSSTAPLASFLRGWTAGLFGILTMAPLAFTWLPLRSFSLPRRSETLAALGTLIVLIITGLTLERFGIKGGFVTLYIFFGIFFWISLRLGQRPLTLALFLTGILDVVGILLLATPETVAARIYSIELFLLLISPIFLILAGAVEERRAAVVALQGYAHELEEALKRLARDDRSKNEFIAILAHELRNPLAPILSTLELLKLKEPRADTRDLIERAESQAHTMRHLLDDLLDVARVAQKKFKLQKDVMELAPFITRIAKNLEFVMKSRKHHFEIVMPPVDAHVYADPIRFEQIISNILHNAAKYTNPGGRIVLACSVDGDDCVITVEDNGIGIDPKKINFIFAPFRQVHQQSHTGTGLGIGLFLTKRLVELHGGVIEAASEGLGRGSRFMVRLPLANGQTALFTGREQSPEPPETITSLRILIVDDNEAAAQGLGRLLEHRGHEVYLVHRGEEVLPAAASFQPQVILMDIGLPDIDGYEVAKRVREAGIAATLIAVTGYGQEEDKLKSMQAGFDDHLVKPVGLADVEAVLARRIS